MLDYRTMTRRQFLNLPLPELKESEESELCVKTREAIFTKNNEEFLKCINNKEFDVNERFDTSYIQRENYLGYALTSSNYFAALKILSFEELNLNDMDKQQLLETLTLHKKYLLLYKILKRLDKNISLGSYIDATISLDYGKIKKRVKK